MTTRILSLSGIRRFARANAYEISCLIAILFVAGFFLFYQIPRDFGDDAISSGIVAEVINQGHRLATPASQLFENLVSTSGNRLLSAYGFEDYGFALPLWHFLLSVTYSIFGVSVFGTLVLTSLIGLLTVILTYFLGKEMYGRLVGLLSAILLSSSLLFVILVRSGSGFIALVPLTVLSAVYFVYIAHKRMNPRYLWVSGIAIGIAFFDADSPVFLLIPVLLFFLIWNLDFRALTLKRANLYAEIGHPSMKDYLLAVKRKLLRNLLGLRHYLLTVAIVLGTFFFSTLGFDAYVGEPPLTTANLIYLRWAAQPTLLALPSSFDLGLVLTNNTKKFFGDMFIAINPFDSLSGAHIQHYLPGTPYVFPFVSAFLVAGLVLSIKRRTAADKMCLIWFFVSLFAVTVLTGFNGRTAIVMAPAIYVIAAKGMVDFIHLFKGSLSFPRISIKMPNKKKWAAVLVICFGVVLTSYTSYQNAFQVYYGQESGRIPRYYGMSGVYGYIMDHSKSPESSQLVLGDPLLLPYDAFVFYTGGQYPVLYWQESVGPLPGMPIQSVSALDQWERNILLNKSNIFYVFGLGGRYTETPGWDLYQGLDQSITYLGAPSIINSSSDDIGWFRELHPFLQPVQTVYYNNGAPAFAVYQVNQTTPRSSPIDLTRGPNEIHSFTSSALDLLTVNGPASNLTVSTNDGNLSLPMSVLPGETYSVTWDKNSQIVFEPLIQSPNYVQDVYEEKDVRFNSSQGSGWVELDGKSGYVVYRLESPFGKIESVTIQTNPRLFNDLGQKDTVDLSYSIDNSNYVPIYEVKSNGNGQWSYYSNPYSFYSSTPVPFQTNQSAGVFERQTYSEVYPDSNVVYLKFVLTGQTGKVQLWSPPGLHQMFFIARFDSSSAPRPNLIPGLNTVVIHSDTGTGNVSIAARGDTYFPDILEAGKLYPSCPWCLRVNNSANERLPDKWIGFDGTDDYVEVPDHTALGGSTALSIEVWFRAERAANDVIFRKGSDPVYFSYIVPGPTVNGSNTFSMYTELGNASTGVVVSTSGWFFNQWHRFVLTYDGLTTRIYRDGVEVYSGTTVTGALKNNTSPILLGMAPGGSQPFQGQIKEVRFYDRALSASEVQGLTNDTGLILYFNTTSWDTNAGTWNDLSGHGNDGTVYGAAAQEGFLPEAALLTYSPNVALDSGTYQADFRLKVSNNSLDAPVATIEVVAGNQVLGELTLKGTEFAKPNVFQSFAVHFETDGKGDLQFRVHDYGAVVLWSDNLDVCSFKGFLITSGPGIRGYAPVPADPVDYGPVPPLGGSGTYQADFRLKVSNNSLDAPVATIEVVAGDKVVAQLVLNGTDFLRPNAYQVFSLNFTTDGNEDLAFKVQYLGKTGIWVDYTYAVPFPMVYRFNYENSRGTTGITVADKSANGGNARYAATTQKGLLVNASSQALNPGTYQADFRLKVADNTLDVPVTKIDVVAGDRVLNQLVLNGADFLQPGTYQIFRLNFTTGGDGSLAFRVYYLGATALWSDYIDVHPFTGLIFESAASLRQIGENVSDSEARDGTARYCSTSCPQGLMEFGPATPLGKNGTYQADFRLKVADNTLDVPVTKIDVVAGSSVLGELTLNGTGFREPLVYQSFAITFKTDGKDDLQYRVLTYAKTDLWADYVEVITVARSFTSSLSNPSIGQNVADGAARSGQARYASYYSPGLLISSPQANFDKGAYQAIFRLKVANSSLAAPVATIDVMSGNKVLNQLVLNGTDFVQPNAYEIFALSFTTVPNENLTFSVHYIGTAALWSDDIEIFQLIPLGR